MAPSLGRDGIPDALRYLVFCLLAPEPGQRPASALEVAGRLEGLRAANAELERLLASSVDNEVLKTLTPFLITILRLTGATSIAAALRHHARRPSRPLQRS
jgi:hypothetical protein